MNFLTRYTTNEEEKEKKSSLSIGKMDRKESRSMNFVKTKTERERETKMEMEKMGMIDKYYPFCSEEEMKEEESLYFNIPLKMQEKDGEFNKGKLLFHVVKQLGAGADLFRISLPPTLMSPCSMLEYISRVLVPTEQLLKIGSMKKVEHRILSLMRWLMINFGKLPAKGICHSKPLNPVVGEIFRCCFENESESGTHFFSEQTSHHPPTSSIIMFNQKNGFTLSGTIVPKSKLYPNSAAICFAGTLEFFIHRTNERFTIEIPQVVAYGIVFGSKYIEVNSTMRVKLEGTKLAGKVEYKAKSRNKVSGKVKDGNTVLYKIEGVNGDVIYLGPKDMKQKREFVKVSDYKDIDEKTKIKNIPLVEQGERESRRIWHRVTRNLLNRNFEDAGKCKNSIEEIEREKRLELKEEEEAFEPKFFKKINDEKFEFFRVDDITKKEEMSETCPELFKYK